MTREDNDRYANYQRKRARKKMFWFVITACLLLLLLLGLAVTPILLFTKPQSQSPPQTPPAKTSMGPMIGHTTHNSVRIWAYYHQNEKKGKDENTNAIELRLFDYQDDNKLLQAQPVLKKPFRNEIFLETFSGLQPSTSYKYGFFSMDEKGNNGTGTQLFGKGKGSFTTAPKLLSNNSNSNSTGTQFEYVLVSCIDYQQYPTQLVWQSIVTETLTHASNWSKSNGHPAFALLAGDSIYLKHGSDIGYQGVDYDRVWYRHQQQRNEANFKSFVRHTPIYSTWNNHDYGSARTDKNQLGKSNSRDAWESLWANPEYGDDNSFHGVYYSFYWGDVHYIVTDDHWNRDPSGNNRLGTEQTEWIEDQLVNSKSNTFKVIVIGSDILQRGWRSDLDNIGEIVTNHQINGVLFHAGDIHRNEFKERNYGSFPYPVKQITSSGVAKVVRRPFVTIVVDTTIHDPTMKAHFYGAVDKEVDTRWVNDETLLCSSLTYGEDRGNEHKCTETIYLSDLTIQK